MHKKASKNYLKNVLTGAGCDKNLHEFLVGMINNAYLTSHDKGWLHIEKCSDNIYIKEQLYI